MMTIITVVVVIVIVWARHVCHTISKLESGMFSRLK
jgi:hypothetical protein